MSSYGQSIFIYEPDGSQNFCVVNLGINQWSPSYVDLRINLFYLWHPVTATPCRDKFNGGSTIDPHLMQINGFIYFIFDILWQLHPVGTNSMEDQALVKSSHIGYREQAFSHKSSNLWTNNMYCYWRLVSGYICLFLQSIAFVDTSHTLL